MSLTELGVATTTDTTVYVVESLLWGRDIVSELVTARLSRMDGRRSSSTLNSGDTGLVTPAPYYTELGSLHHLDKFTHYLIS